MKNNAIELNKKEIKEVFGGNDSNEQDSAYHYYKESMKHAPRVGMPGGLKTPTETGTDDDDEKSFEVISPLSTNTTTV